MTRERKLAIEMWEEVKKQLPGWKCDVVFALKTLKANFCRQNGLDWRYDCWFCQYVRDDCHKCPLHSCDCHNFATAWARIVDEGTSLRTKLAACDDIIAALKGEQA